MKKILLLLMAATLTLGFTACSDDDDDYPTLAQRNADLIRSMGIKQVVLKFNEERYGNKYDVIGIEGDFLILKDNNPDNYWEPTFTVPLENIKVIVEERGVFYIYL